MTSDKQLTANRLNAMLSTGPKSINGKTRSSQNSITHGLTASKVVIEGEDQEDYALLLTRLIDEFEAERPRGALELELIHQLAANLWRIRRVPQIEAALFGFLSQRQKLEVSGPSVNDFPLLGVHDADVLDASAGAQSAFGRVCDLILTRGDALAKLTRYEAVLLKKVDYLIGKLSEH